MSHTFNVIISFLLVVAVTITIVKFKKIWKYLKKVGKREW